MEQTEFQGWFLPVETGRAHYFREVQEGDKGHGHGDFQSLCGHWVIPAWHAETCHRITQNSGIERLCSRCYPLEAELLHQQKEAAR